MPQSEIIKGNVIINQEEIHELREATVTKFEKLTGQSVHPWERTFNSNLSNYNDLRLSIINSNIDIDFKSNKPFAVLFHSPNNNENPSLVFRKKFIDTLYRYCYGVSRDEFLQSTKSKNIGMRSNNPLKSIQGYWECYYDKRGRFADQLHRENDAQLGKIAYWICDNNNLDNSVYYYQNKSSGKGSIEIKGTNLIFRLLNDFDSTPEFLIMNCGREINDSVFHFNKMVGCFLHVDDAASPKTGKCVMYYLPERNWQIENQTEREKFESETIVVFKRGIIEQERIRKEIMEFFFEDDTNTITANLNVFKEIVRKPRLETTNK